ncbi:MAG: DUF1330 domain-containing protein [Pseudomonadota bacterium]|nr:DUF1330 domain-containing protein [Pseudomonadota bacterium]
MPKGYWIAHVTVTDASVYPDYIATAKPAFEKYGARFLARGGAFECVEGKSGERHVVIEFDSMEKALACYRSEQYQKAKKIREKASSGTITIIEGA